jgi:spermidine/putrescine transport system substrate-binding protein
LPTLSAILAACQTRSDSSTGAQSDVPLARPGSPVTLPTYDDNQPIADGMAAEAGPLTIFSWNDYIYKKVLNRFESEAGVKINYTGFGTMSEAITKIQNGTVDFDVMPGLTVDELRTLVLAKQVRPLNQSYLPNVQGVLWPQLKQPFYDLGFQYSVPYMTWKSGVGYRTDKVNPAPSGDPASAFDLMWDTQYKDMVSAFNGYRDLMAVALLHNGVNDVNTSDPTAIKAAGDSLLQMIQDVNIKVGGATALYQQIAEGSIAVGAEWSGDMNYARYYLPKGTPTSVLGFYPPPGGVVGNDVWVVSANAKNPVLAHNFINFMYDKDNALDNFSYEGYQPPLAGVETDEWLSRGYIPDSLSQTIVAPEDFDAGKNQQIAGLSADVDQLYQDAWASFTAGATPSKN